MGISVLDVLEGKVGRWEPNIWLSVHPHGQRIPIGDEDPLSKVKLPVAYYERVFDVFLDDPLQQVGRFVRFV